MVTLLLTSLSTELAVFTHRPPTALTGLPADELILRHPLLVVALALLLGQQFQLLDDVLGPLLVLTVLPVYVGGQACRKAQ